MNKITEIFSPRRVFEAETQYSVEDMPGSEKGKVLKYVEDAFTANKDFMEEQWRPRWRTNEAGVNNELHNGPINYNKKLTQMKPNIIHSIIEAAMPIMANAIPSGDVRPQEYNDMGWSIAFAPRVNQIKDNAELQEVLEDQAHDMAEYGCGLISGFPEFVMWQGNRYFTGYKFQNIDLFTWFPSRDSTNVDIFENSKNQLLAVPTHINEIRANYPQTGKDVQPEGEIGDYRSWKNNLESDDDDKGDHVLKKICFWYDPTDERYPNGRMAVVAGGVLLDSKPLWSELALDPRQHKPLSPLYLAKHYGNKNQLCGKGLPELLETVVKPLHEVLSSTADNIREAGNTGWLATEEWVNRGFQKPQGITGEINQVRAQGELVRKTVSPLPPEAFVYIQLLLNFPQILSHLEDTARGKPNSPDQSGRAIRELKTASESVISYATRKSFKKIIKRITNDIIWGLKRWDTETITIKQSMMGEEGGPVYLTYNPQDEVGGQKLKDSKFETVVEPGIPFPKGSAAYEEMLLSHLQAGIIDGEYYIMNSSLKDKEVLLKRFQDRQEANKVIEEIEIMNKMFPKFEKLTQEALQISQSDEPEMFFSENSPLLPNLADMVKSFPDYMETNEWQALPENYKQAILSGAFIFQEPPQNQQASPQG